MQIKKKILQFYILVKNILLQMISEFFKPKNLNSLSVLQFIEILLQ